MHLASFTSTMTAELSFVVNILFLPISEINTPGSAELMTFTEKYFVPRGTKFPQNLSAIQVKMTQAQKNNKHGRNGEKRGNRECDKLTTFSNL